VADTCNSNTWEAEADAYVKFQASLRYIVKPCSSPWKIPKRKENGMSRLFPPPPGKSSRIVWLSGALLVSWTQRIAPFFLPYCDKYPGKVHLSEKKLILVHRSRLQSIVLCKSQWLELEATNHFASLVKKEEPINGRMLDLSLHFHPVQDTAKEWWCHTVGRSSTLNLIRIIPTNMLTGQSDPAETVIL
jgi:hypothetical protein